MDMTLHPLHIPAKSTRIFEPKFRIYFKELDSSSKCSFKKAVFCKISARIVFWSSQANQRAETYERNLQPLSTQEEVHYLLRVLDAIEPIINNSFYLLPIHPSHPSANHWDKDFTKEPVSLGFKMEYLWNLAHHKRSTGGTENLRKSSVWDISAPI